MCKSTICPWSLDPFYLVTYYLKRFNTSWTYSTIIAMQKKLERKELYFCINRTIIWEMVVFAFIKCNLNLQHNKNIYFKKFISDFFAFKLPLMFYFRNHKKYLETKWKAPVFEHLWLCHPCQSRSACLCSCLCPSLCLFLFIFLYFTIYLPNYLCISLYCFS